MARATTMSTGSGWSGRTRILVANIKTSGCWCVRSSSSSLTGRCCGATSYHSYRIRGRKVTYEKSLTIGFTTNICICVFKIQTGIHAKNLPSHLFKFDIKTIQEYMDPQFLNGIFIHNDIIRILHFNFVAVIKFLKYFNEFTIEYGERATGLTDGKGTLIESKNLCFIGTIIERFGKSTPNFTSSTYTKISLHNFRGHRSE